MSMGRAFASIKIKNSLPPTCIYEGELVFMKGICIHEGNLYL